MNGKRKQKLFGWGGVHTVPGGFISALSLFARVVDVAVNLQD